MRTIFFYKLLDNHLKSCVGNYDIPLPLFADKYVAHRVLNEPDHGRPGLVFIRKVAECLCQANSDGRGISDFVQELSQLLSGGGMNNVAILWSIKNPLHFQGETLEDNVNIAALYTGVASIVEKLVLDQKLGITKSWLFGPARHYTCLYDNERMIDATVGTSTLGLEVELRRDMLHVAAEAGKMACVNFIWNSNTDNWPWEFVRRGESRNAKRNEIALAQLETPSPEVFEFLMEKRRIHCTTRQYDEKKYTRFLCSCAHKGWTDMASRYLDLGASIEGLTPVPGFVIGEWEERPLINACRYGFEDLVDLLLARGADTSRPVLECAARKGKLSIVRKLLDHNAEIGQSLLEAAKKGWGDIVQELLSCGARIDSDLQPLLLAAIEQEHTSMFHLLVQSSHEKLDGAIAIECLRFAHEKGLESMARLVEEVRC